MTDQTPDLDDLDQMEAHLELLQSQHVDLDAQIMALEASQAEPFKIMALKREKLQIKDKITWLVARLTPDIIA